MLTTQDVIDAFDSLGGHYNHVNALEARLQQRSNRPSEEVRRAINEAVSSGALSSDQSGQVKKT